MRTRKSLVISLASMLVVVSLMLTGCGSSGKKTVKVGDYTLNIASKEKSKLEIPVVYMNVTNPFAGLIKQGVDAAAKDLGVHGYLTGPTDWATDQEVRVIEDLISKKVDGISLAVLDIPGMTPVIQKALKAGIPTTCYNVDAPDSGRLGFVGEDLVKSGEATAQAVIDKLGPDPKGKILITGVALDAVWSIKREDGVMNVLKKYPGIEIVQRVNAAGDEQAAVGAIENAFMAHQDIVAHISLGGTLPYFARVMKLHNAGNNNSDKPIWSTGHDMLEEALVAIDEGWATASFGQDPYKQGYEAVKQLTNFLTTADPAAFSVIDTGLVPVNKDNVKVYLQKLKNGEPVG